MSRKVPRSAHKGMRRLLTKLSKQSVQSDPALDKMLTPFFLNATERKSFVASCLKRIKSQRMLLRLNWYTELADGIGKVRPGRPALQLIYLMALAERTYKRRTGHLDVRSFEAIEGFFSLIRPQDKKELIRGIRRSLAVGVPTPQLRFKTLLRILYQVRNQAVHGEDFWSFMLLDPATKKKYAHYTHFSTGTSGTILGKTSKKTKKRRKTRIPLDVTMTYGELKDIFIRTALENIQAILIP